MQINEFSNKDIDRMISKYNNEKISKILNLIDDKEKEVFTLYYGINCPKQSKKAIAAKLNITTGELNEILDNVYSTIEQIYPNDFSSIKNLFYSEFTGYSKEDVDKELAKIDDIHRQVLEKYFALKGDKIPTKHIIEEYKLRSGIEYYLKSGIALIIKKLENRPIPLDSFKQKFYQIFKEYSLEEITMAFNKLDDTQKNILSFYYALNGEKMTSKKIATKYNLKDEFEAISIIRKSMGVIKRQLDNKKLAEKYRKEFYQLFEEFKEEQIDDALSQIDENSRNVINAYYGLKGDA